MIQVSADAHLTITVEVSRSSVFPGQAGVPVLVHVDNLTNDELMITGLELHFSRSGLDVSGWFTVTPDPANPAQLLPIQSQQLTAWVDVAEEANEGDVQLTALAHARLSDGSQILANSSGAPVLWQVSHTAVGEMGRRWVEKPGSSTRTEYTPGVR